MSKFFGIFRRREKKLVAGAAGNEVSRSRRRATVGLDFGTSSAKVCVRDEGREGSHSPVVVAFGHANFSPTPFFPTRVSLLADKILFGPDAPNTRDVLRSFKMCLPCRIRGERAVGSPCPRCGTGEGVFQGPGYLLAADDLCSLHLAVILAEVIPAIPEIIEAREGNVRIHVNMGSPLDRVGDAEKLRRLVESVLDRALRLVQHEEIQPRRAWPTTEWVAALALVPKHDVDPLDKSRETSVYPETHAAMNSLVHQRGQGNALFCLVDIGAGTTDVSFLWLQRKDDGEDIYWTYSTGTVEKGMDDVDRLFPEHEAEQIRNDPGMRNRLLYRVAQSDGLRKLQSTFYTHFNRLFHEAKSRDHRPESWVEGCLRPEVKLVGGGAQCDDYWARLESDVPSAWSCKGWKRPIERLELEDSLGAWICTSAGARRHTATLEGVRRFHVLAHGLAYRRVDIPDVRTVKPKAPELTHRVDCPCQGTNDACYRCGGTGWRI